MKIWFMDKFNHVQLHENSRQFDTSCFPIPKIGEHINLKSGCVTCAFSIFDVRYDFRLDFVLVLVDVDNSQYKWEI